MIMNTIFSFISIDSSRICAPLPQIVGRWPPKLKLLRESVEKTLLRHNKFDVKPHDDCPGLQEYVEMWAELEDLIQHANSTENGTASRYLVLELI